MAQVEYAMQSVYTPELSLVSRIGRSAQYLQLVDGEAVVQRFRTVRNPVLNKVWLIRITSSTR